MKIHQLPGYHIEDVDMPKRYAKSLRESLDSKQKLFEHIDRWKAAWELWPKKDRSIKKILNKQISNRTLKRLKNKGIRKDFVAGKRDSIICDLLVPPVLLKASSVAKVFGVPFCTALHQYFCTLDNHELCF